MASIIQLRRDTVANWSSANPTLAQGELGIETDTLKIKVGDGITAWSSLDYYNLGMSVVLSKSFVITNPTSDSDSPLWRIPYSITALEVHVLCIGGTSIVGMIDEYDENGANPVPVDDSDITGVAGTNVDDDGSLNNETIDSGHYLGWHTTAVNGEVTRVIITLDYKIA